jgi:predicted SAM-dependent methyltransferase
MPNSNLIPLFGLFIGERKLNIGCAGNPEPGWDNLDCEPRTNPDILHALGAYNPIPKPDNTYDTILASHVLEHVEQAALFYVMKDLHRVLKPNGYLIAITPYGSSDDAWDNPHHKQLFTENTFAFFSKRLYEVGDTAGHKAYEGQDYADWVIAKASLVPYPEFANDPDIEYKKRHFRNVIRELQVVLRAVKS